MKRILLLFIPILFVIAIPATAQDSVTRLLRIYEDNDGINALGQSTDDAYTNGTRIDYFYTPAHRPHGVLGKWAPGAGEGSVDIYGWGLMQLMYTPNDLTQSTYQSNDYPYSGALLATHTRYSYNPVKQYDLQTEIVAGVLGPASLAHQTQSIVHRLTGFDQPEGWGTQFHNALLLNVNFTAEKQIAAAGKWLQLIGGGQLYAGTMQNGAGIYTTLLIGGANPYFNGFFGQYTGEKKKWRLYGLLKPELQYFLTNALLEGGVFTTNPNLPKKEGTPSAFSQSPANRPTDPPPPPTYIPVLNRLVSSFSYGGVLTHGRFGISFTQNVSSATLKRLYCHDVGNVSLYFGW